MQHLISHGGHMERLGLIGTIWAWTFNLFAFFMNEQFLKEVSLVLAIIVSILTICWYMGQFILKRKEFLREIKAIIRRGK